MRQTIIISSGFIALLFALAAGILWYKNNYAAVNSFEECKQAGYPVQESNPPICRANAKVFMESAQ